MSARFVHGRPNLVWLEDRERTARTELGEANRLGCAIHLRGQPMEIAALLAEELGADFEPMRLNELRVAFVIDIMISGLFDLSSLGIRYSNTSGGLNGGYVFADRFLRSSQSQYRFCPICFLSEREVTEDLAEDLELLSARRDRNGRLHGSVTYVRKFNSRELMRFQKFLLDI